MIGAFPGAPIVTADHRRRNCCCLSCLSAVILAVLAVFLIVHAVTTPSTVATSAVRPARGPADGNSTTAIASHLQPQVTAGLAAAPHTHIIVSEKDLTIITGSNTSLSFDLDIQNVHAYVDNNDVVVNGQGGVGPWSTNVSARLSLTTQPDSTGQQHVVAQLKDLTIGTWSLPTPLRDSLGNQLQSSVDLSSLFAVSPAFTAMESNLDCIGYTKDGILLSFHRSGIAPDPHQCP